MQLQRGFSVLVFVGVDLAVLELRALVHPQLDRHRGFGRVRRLGAQGESRAVGCWHDAEGILQPHEQRHEVARNLDTVILDEAPVEQVTAGTVDAALLHVEEAGQAALALEVVAPAVAEAEDVRVDEQGEAGEA